MPNKKKILAQKMYRVALFLRYLDFTSEELKTRIGIAFRYSDFKIIPCEILPV